MTRIVAITAAGDEVALAASIRTRADVEVALAEHALTGSGAPTDAAVPTAAGTMLPWADVDHVEERDG